MNVLADITNLNGKRVLPLSAQKNDTGRKMRKHEGKLQDSSFTRPLDGSTTLKGKEKVLAVPRNQEKRLPSFDPKHSPDSRNSGCRSGSLQENALASLLSLSMNPDSSTFDVTNGDRLEQGPVSGQCTKSSDLSSEFEDVVDVTGSRPAINHLDFHLDVHEGDNTKSVRYHFPTEKGLDKCASSHHANNDFAQGKADPVEGAGKDSVGETSFGGIPKSSTLLDYKNNSLAKLLNASPSCDETDIGIEASCKCSFCLKAAYIWTDLHYQDTRGRLSGKLEADDTGIIVPWQSSSLPFALRKSRKLAKSLEVQICSNDWDIKATRDRTKKQPTELDAELMHHWRSLFHQTDNVLVHETAQLNATVLRLKSLRTNCEKDVERMKQVPLDK